jgi:hypothetical protein
MCEWARFPHCPALQHRQGLIADPDDRLVEQGRPREDTRDSPMDSDRDEDPVLQRRGLGDDSEDISRLDEIAFSHTRLEGPGPFAIERGHGDTTREHWLAERVVADSCEYLERPLRSVEDATKETRAELDLKRPAGVDDGLAGSKTGCVLVHLDRRQVAIEADHLARELCLAHTDDVVEPHAWDPARHDDGPGHAPDLPRRKGVLELHLYVHPLLLSLSKVIS